MEDCRTIGVDVLGGQMLMNLSSVCSERKGQIRFGLGAIKGMGEAF